VAALLVTTEAMVAEMPKEPAPPAAGGGHGHGGGMGF
jgi:chaperonin GroEL